MSADLDAVAVAVAVSFLVVPGSLLVLLPVEPGAPAAWVGAVGAVAMLPGFLLGAAGLWTAARG
jgi:hypothetical protein